MEELIERLTRLFSSQFSGSVAELEPVRPIDKVGGYLIWEGFEEMEQIDRQRQVSNVVRTLVPGDRSRVTTILTLTPAEAMAMREG
jgi:hypothetical protein